MENAVGAHLLNRLYHATHQVYYWRDGDQEVDYALKTPKNLWAVEVKSSESVRRFPLGLGAFKARYPHARPFIVGAGGMDLEEFFLSDPSRLFD